MKPIHTVIKRGVKKLGNGILLFLLPRAGKRAVFLSTLFMEVAKLSPEHRDMLRTLDERFNLTCRREGLPLPSALHDFIWEDRHLIVYNTADDITEDELTSVCRLILKKAPSWCHYGGYSHVLAETKEVVREALKQRKQESTT